MLTQKLSALSLALALLLPNLAQAGGRAGGQRESPRTLEDRALALAVKLEQPSGSRLAERLATAAGAVAVGVLTFGEVFLRPDIPKLGPTAVGALAGGAVGYGTVKLVRGAHSLYARHRDSRASETPAPLAKGQ